mmetsp:Transcript_31952/g.51873  ORF Transcript_31952/g.51873 Transcript_31952/m.51873 type:complete len:314 (+) Transcript_31952:124-1065(+)
MSMYWKALARVIPWDLLVRLAMLAFLFTGMPGLHFGFSEVSEFSERNLPQEVESDIRSTGINPSQFSASQYLKASIHAASTMDSEDGEYDDDDASGDTSSSGGVDVDHTSKRIGNFLEMAYSFFETLFEDGGSESKLLPQARDDLPAHLDGKRKLRASIAIIGIFSKMLEKEYNLDETSISQVLYLGHEEYGTTFFALCMKAAAEVGSSNRPTQTIISFVANKILKENATKFPRDLMFGKSQSLLRDVWKDGHRGEKRKDKKRKRNTSKGSSSSSSSERRSKQQPQKKSKTEKKSKTRTSRAPSKKSNQGKEL